MHFLVGVIAGAVPAYYLYKKNKKNKQKAFEALKEEGNRPANILELEEAKRSIQWLTYFQIGVDLIKKYISSYSDYSKKADLPSDFPMVVTDFTQPVDSNIILVPPGTYRVPLDFMSDIRYFVGLRTEDGELPKIYLEGDTEEVIHSDTQASTSLQVFEPLCPFSFLNVELMADTPTMIQVRPKHASYFTENFLNVEFSPNIEVVDVTHNIVMHERPWAKNALGSKFVKRSKFCKTVESVYEGITKPLSAIDKYLDERN